MLLQVYLVDEKDNNIILENVLKTQEVFEVINNKSMRYILISFQNGNTVKYDDSYRLKSVWNNKRRV